ncbi:MAG: methyl-accepting chemotaxis protein [Gemmatimonadota bacterium]|nr:MAG: methyl-accepting chemotaxis protein [Gemmatimonadota bacterium]
MLVGTPITILAVAGGAYIATQATTQQFERIAHDQLLIMSQRSTDMVDQYMQERLTDVIVFARTPLIQQAAQSAADDAMELGLDRLPTDSLEELYADRRELGASQQVQQFLITTSDESDFSELFFAQRHGLVVSATGRTSDFVQSDEDWWDHAEAVGTYRGPAVYDESAGIVGVELAARIADPVSGQFSGVVKALLDLSQLSQLLSDGAVGAATVEAIDSTGRVVLSSDPASLFTLADDAQLLLDAEDGTVVWLPGVGGGEFASTTVTLDGGWRVVVRQPATVTNEAAITIRNTIYVAAGAVAVVIVLMLAWLTEWLHRRVTQPIQIAGTVAQRVADGDLSMGAASDGRGTAEVRHLLLAVRKMVDALRNLVAQIRTSAHESAAMAEQISAATEEMSASTQEMANTCQDLSSQATEQAELARQSADDAARILGISTTLADGAKVSAERSTILADTANEHRQQLLEGGKQLAQLASDLERGAADAERLAEMSQEIQQFLTQSKAIATQTNMLALNAAIEASRASGGEGRGFAVVAEEVRKLANQAARSAVTTSDVVRGILTTVQETQNRLTNLAHASTAVRQVAESAAGALEEVAGATAESSAWGDEISRAAGEVNGLVEEITRRVQAISQGTESVVAAAEQIAASAEQQSASTEQIAASASQLADAADRLTLTVGSFRLAGGEQVSRAVLEPPTDKTS